MKLTIKYIAILLLFLTSEFSSAQSQKVIGKALDIDSQPVEGAVVILYDTSLNILSHAITDQKGAYELESEVKASYSLELTHLTYSKMDYTFTETDVKDPIIIKDFQLTATMTVFDEIVFVGKRKDIDTVRYDLEKLNLLESDNLEEILSKIPDFKIGTDGSIIYKGKNIDKILVNDKPSFENQNTIALESIEKSIVDGISLINNYSDEFKIDFNENEETVINIDTKKKNQHVLTSEIDVKYGFKNNYEVQAKSFLFAQKLNAFLTHNTNNIGETRISTSEVQKIFSEGQPFSGYQKESLNSMFSLAENLQKDFFSSTKLTLRNQTRKLKTSALIYHIAPNRINSFLQNNSTINDVALLNTSSSENIKSSSILSAFSMAYKPASNTILKYTLNSNYIDDTKLGDTKTQLFSNGIESSKNTLTSTNQNKIFSGYHKALVENKLSKNLIFESMASFFHENTKFNNEINIIENSITTSDSQFYKFNKEKGKGSVGMKYKLSEQFIPLLSFDFNKSKEVIADYELNKDLLQRDQEMYLMNLNLRGNNVIYGLDYKFEIGVNPMSTQLNSTDSNKNTFIPVSIWMNYDRRLHRYNLSFKSSRRFTELETGINTIQPFNRVWIGDMSIPSQYTTSNEFNSSYSYHNFFDAEIFSLSFAYRNIKNDLRRNFAGIENGIASYQLFLVDNTNIIDISGYYSKTVLPLKYPTKVSLSLDYTNTRYPLQITQGEVDIVNSIVTPKLAIETLSNHFINMSYISQISFFNDGVVGNSFKGIYMNNTLSFILKNKTWKGNIDLLYDHNIINDTRFSRKNINLGLSYTKNKITFSFEARHLGELFNIFQNESYNSTFFLRDGIATTTINNQSLNYAILGIKFKL